MLRTSLLLLHVSMGTLSPVWAATVDDGLDLFQQGDFAAARDVWLPLAEHGDGRAAYYMSLLYAQGKGVPKDPSLAMESLEGAAENGHAVAQLHLGNHYNKGKWVEQNPSMAAQWWRKASEQGIVSAQHNLATLYLLGRGIKQDIREARHWFEQAAKHGSEASALMLEQIEPDQPGSGRLASLSTTEMREVEAKAESKKSAVAEVVSEEPVSTQEIDKPEIEEASAVKPAQPAPKPPKAAESAEVLGHDWVNQQASDNFTLQLFVGDSDSAVKRQLKRYESVRPAAVYEYRANGKSLFAAVYGQFDSRANAKSGVAALPKSLRKNSPWIRRFGDIQALIKKLDKSEENTEG